MHSGRSKTSQVCKSPLVARSRKFYKNVVVVVVVVGGGGGGGGGGCDGSDGIEYRGWVITNL